MKAAVYTQYGSPDVLHISEVPKPQPQPGEVLIKIQAVPVGYGDLTARDFANLPLSKFNMPAPLYFPTRMMFGWKKPRNPILGSEFSGEVVEIGSQVAKFKVGDLVYGYVGMNMGAYAEYLCMPENGTLAIRPAGMSAEDAACLPYGSIMAVSLLEKGNIQPGHKVLINGASGGIGSLAVQLAKHYGAEVTGVCGTARVAYVKSLGADHVIDYTQQDFTQNGEKYDLIFDILGKSAFSHCKNALIPNGRYLLASFKVPDLFQMLWTSFFGSKKVICAFADERPESLDTVRKLVEAGAVTSIIDRVYPLEQAAAAHHYVESGQKQANVVLSLIE